MNLQKFNFTLKMIHHPVFFWFLAVVFVLSTHLWLPFPESLEYVHADDSINYLKIANAAPTLLHHEYMIQYHAERFFSHYAVGFVSYYFKIPVFYPYFFSVIFLYTCIFYIIYKLSKKIGFKDEVTSLIGAILILNPYMLRQHLLAPTLVADVLYIFGLVYVIKMLFLKNSNRSAFGVLIAGLGRQNHLTLMPGILYQIWSVRSELTFVRKMLPSVLVLAASVTIFVLNRWIASYIATVPGGVSPFLALFQWINGVNFSWMGFVEHFARIIIPFTAILSLLVTSRSGVWKIFKERFWLVLMVLGTSAMPFLAGPEASMQNQARQSSLGLAPAVFLCGFSLQLIDFQKRFFLKWAILGVLALMSLHHVFSVWPLESRLAIQSVILQVVLGLTLMIVITRVGQKNEF